MDLPKHDPKIPKTMEDDITTRKHHYIPEFFLKGFTDNNNKLYRYDKQFDSFKYVGGRGVFWEENLNTGSIKHPETGEMHLSDMAEHLFAGLDSGLSTFVEIIRNTDATTNIMATPAVVELTKQLIHFLYWRSPANTDHLEKMINEKAWKDIGWGLFDQDGNRYSYWEEKMKEVDLWRKTYPALVAASRKYSSFANNNNGMDWGVYYMNWKHALVTDNPVILRTFDGPASLEGNLLFPISLRMLVVAVEGKKKERLPAIVREQIDVLLFHQAQRYVACPTKEYIMHIMKTLHFYVQQGADWEARLKEQIFACLTEK